MRVFFADHLQQRLRLYSVWWCFKPKSPAAKNQASKKMSPTTVAATFSLALIVKILCMLSSLTKPVFFCQWLSLEMWIGICHWRYPVGWVGYPKLPGWLNSPVYRISLGFWGDVFLLDSPNQHHHRIISHILWVFVRARNLSGKTVIRTDDFAVTSHPQYSKPWEFLPESGLCYLQHVAISPRESKGDTLFIGFTNQWGRFIWLQQGR